jgi:hypothetical protein
MLVLSVCACVIPIPSGLPSVSPCIWNAIERSVTLTHFPVATPRALGVPCEQDQTTTLIKAVKQGLKELDAESKAQDKEKKGCVHLVLRCVCVVYSSSPCPDSLRCLCLPLPLPLAAASTVRPRP